MSAKTFFVTFVLVGACALVAGCGSDSVAPTGGSAPILPPANVAVSSSGTVVTVSWDASTQSNLVGYRVYRLDVDTQAILTLTHTPIAETMYEDTSARAGTTYEYRVTAVGASGAESGFVSRVVTLPSVQRDGEKRDREL